MAQTLGERQDHHEHMIELERIASALERIADAVQPTVEPDGLRAAIAKIWVAGGADAAEQVLALPEIQALIQKAQGQR